MKQVIAKRLKYVKVGSVELIEQPSGVIRILHSDTRLGDFYLGTLQDLVGALTGLLTAGES